MSKIMWESNKSMLMAATNPLISKEDKLEFLSLLGLVSYKVKVTFWDRGKDGEERDIGEAEFEFVTDSLDKKIDSVRLGSNLNHAISRLYEDYKDHFYMSRFDKEYELVKFKLSLSYLRNHLAQVSLDNFDKLSEGEI